MTVHLAERDGCGCPDWVERCVHFDGAWLALHRTPGGACWAVCGGEGEPEYCAWDIGHNNGQRFVAVTEQEAITAFEEYELKLLGRVE